MEKGKKTVKLVCIITGKEFNFNKQYYNSKVEKAGSEEALHDTYVCREALHFLKKGYSIAKTRELLDVDITKVKPISDEMIPQLVGDGKRPVARLNIQNYDLDQIETKSDPDVVKFIENILNE